MNIPVGSNQDYLKSSRILNVLLQQTTPDTNDQIALDNSRIAVQVDGTVQQTLFLNDIEPFNASDDFTTNPNNLSTRQSIRQYVQQFASGYDPKASVVASSTSNITISNPGTDIFDGATLTNGDRLLLKDQSNAVENGIYIFNGAGAALTRSADFDNEVEVTQGAYTFIVEGNTYQGTAFIVISEGTGTDGHIIGTDAINWTQLSGPANLVGGDGINITGNTINIDLVDSNSGLQFTGLSNELEVNTSVLAGNGLTAGANNAIDLGGTLTQNANILIDSNDFSVANIGATEQVGIYITNSGPFPQISMASGGINTGIPQNFSSLSLDNNSGTIIYYTTTIGTSIGLDIFSSGAIFRDDINSKGLEYAANYSANFTNNSLINKIYADSNINGKSTSTIDALNTNTGPGLTEDGYILAWDNTLGEYVLAAPTTTSLSNGSGTTVNGNAVDLGGTLTADVTISTGTNDFNIFYLTPTIQSGLTIENSGSNPIVTIISSEINSGIPTNFSNITASSQDGITLGYTTTIGSSTILSIDSNESVFQDNINSKGLEYAADYSANFTGNSLVTKTFVENRIPNIAETISSSQSVGVVGNVTNVDGQTYIIVHNLGTEDVSITVYNLTTGSDIIVQKTRNNVNAIQIEFGITVEGGGTDYRVVIK